MKFIAKGIAQNVFFHTTGQILSLFINLLAIAIGGRYLGVSDFGIFGYLSAITIILSKLIDFGVTPNIFREWSISRKEELLNTGILLRIVFFFLLMIIFNCIGFLFQLNIKEIILSDILFINIVFSSKGLIRELLEIPYKVELKIYQPIGIMIFDNVLFLIMVLILPYFDVSVFSFTLAYVLSNIPGFFFMIVLTKKKYNYFLSKRITSIKSLIQKSLPVFVFIITTTLFQQIDLLFLKNIDSSYAAGIYSAALRLILPILFIPTAIIHTVFPIIVSNLKESSDKNELIINFIFKLLFFISFFIAAAITFKSKLFSEIIYGNEFSDVSFPLCILLWSQIFNFHSYFIINLLVAYDKQKSITIYSIAIIFLNLILDLFLIYPYSYLGAAYAKLISYFVGFIITLYIVLKRRNQTYFFNRGNILLSTIILFLFYIYSFLNIIVYLMLVVFSFICVTLYIKYFSQYEIEYIFKMFQKEKWLNNKIIMKYLRSFNVNEMPNMQ